MPKGSVKQTKRNAWIFIQEIWNLQLPLYSAQAMFISVRRNDSCCLQNMCVASGIRATRCASCCHQNMHAAVGRERFISQVRLQSVYSAVRNNKYIIARKGKFSQIAEAYFLGRRIINTQPRQNVRRTAGSTAPDSNKMIQNIFFYLSVLRGRKYF